MLRKTTACAVAAWMALFATAAHAQGTSPSGGSSWADAESVVEASRRSMPQSDADVQAIAGHAAAILALAGSCNAARCPTVETCGQAGRLLQALTDALAYLDATEAALNRAQAAAAAAHNSVAGQAGVSVANTGVAQEALGLKQYLYRLGTLIFDLASLSEDILNMAKKDPKEVQATWQKIDAAYETLKDAESVLNGMAQMANDYSSGPTAPPPTTVTPLSDLTAKAPSIAKLKSIDADTMSTINDLKSSVSDAANTLKELKELYDKNGKQVTDDMLGGLGKAAMKIAFRALKVKVEQQMRELEDYIKDLQRNLDAEQKILGNLFQERMRMGERRAAAQAARLGVIAAREALMACMARTCGLPSLTRPSLPNYFAPPTDAGGVPIPQSQYAGWSDALSDLGPRLASVEMALRERFTVKDICPGGGGSFADPGSGGTGFISSGGFKPRHLVKTNCAPCQPLADAMARTLDEIDFYGEEVRRIERSVAEAAEIRARIRAKTNELATHDRYIEELKSIIEYGQTPLGTVAGSAQQNLALAMSKRTQLVSELAALRRDLERLESERARLPALKAKLEALNAHHAELHAKLRYCEEDLCRLGYLGELDTWINISGNNPLDPSDPIGQPGADGRPVATVTMTRPTGEGGAPGAFTIALSRPAPPGGMFFEYSFEGSATPGADYAAVSVGAQMLAGASSVEVTVTPIDDTLIEGPEEVHLTLRPGQGYALGVPSRAIMPFSDNDAPQEGAGVVQFSQSAYDTAENAGNVTITVTRSGGTAGAVTVGYSVLAGTAAAGIDFQPVAGNVSWQAGESVPKTFTVPIIDDSAVEGAESFQVRLAAPTGGATLGALSTSTVTIADNDAATGPCAPAGSAWAGNAGTYFCSGTCDPCPSPQMVSVNGDIVTVSPFHANGAATFQGCGNAIQSQSNTLRFFGQSNHNATLTRSSNNNFTAQVRSSGGGTCVMSCFR